MNLIQDKSLEYTHKLIGTNGEIYYGQILKKDDLIIKQGYGVEKWPDGEKLFGFWWNNDFFRG